MTYAFGDIVVAAGGTYSSKPRPVLVFQNQDHPTGQSVVVIPFTSDRETAQYYRLPVIPSPTNARCRPHRYLRSWPDV